MILSDSNVMKEGQRDICDYWNLELAWKFHTEYNTIIWC